MSDFNELINSTKPTLVDFYADWCSPCKMMSPIIDETKKDLGGNATILKVNIDNNASVANKYGIRSIPTLVLFKEGEIVWRQSGVPSKSLIVESVKKYISTHFTNENIIKIGKSDENTKLIPNVKDNEKIALYLVSGSPHTEIQERRPGNVSL